MSSHYLLLGCGFDRGFDPLDAEIWHVASEADKIAMLLAVGEGGPLASDDVPESVDAKANNLVVGTIVCRVVYYSDDDCVGPLTGVDVADSNLGAADASTGSVHMDFHLILHTLIPPSSAIRRVVIAQSG